jgi:hypothetical protein
VPSWPDRGERKRERKVRDDKRGRAVRERGRARERERVRADGPRCWAVRAAGPGERGWAVRAGRERTAVRDWAARCWAEPEGKVESARAAVLFFFFKNINSVSFYLFQ